MPDHSLKPDSGASSSPLPPATPSVASRAATGAFDAIDAHLLAQMRRLKIPGAALAIVEGDRIVHQRGFGRAGPDAGPPTPHTPFFIGSLTKSMTAVAVMQLVEAGTVDLDAPVQRYLPWFRLADPGASARITVRHLLNQTSGLPTLLGEVVLADLDDRPDATERQVRALSTLKLTRPVGSACVYSNLNYNILGLIIEAVSGESYAPYVEDHLFGPLDMRHSYTSKTLAVQDGLATGHRHWLGRPVPSPDLPVPRGCLPSGQLISCAEDMAHYLIAQLNGGRYRDAQILSPAAVAELHRGVAELITFGISSGRYAMGWLDITIDGTRIVSHAGNVPEFSAFAALLPALHRGLVVLFNADPYGLPPLTEEVGMGLAALLAGLLPPPRRLDFLPSVMRLPLLIPPLQLAGVLATLRFLARLRSCPPTRAHAARISLRHLLLPLVPNGALVAALAYLRAGGLLRFTHLYLPELAAVVRISGTFAGVWALLRTGLILRALRGLPAPDSHQEDSHR